MAVSTRRKPMTNVEADLEAAATPIIPEPVAGQVPYRRDLRQEQIDRLVAAGSDASTATMVVDRLAEIHGSETPMALFDHYNNPRDNEALRQRIAAGKVADARMDGFARNYNAETGHPEYGYDEAGNAARLGRVDIDKPSERELVDRGRRAYNARDPRGAEVAAAGGQIYGDYVPSDEVAQPLGMTAPGPRTLDGRPTAMPKPLMTPEDVEAYDVRKPGGLSQRDEAMAQRGYVPVVTPDGVSYMLAYVPSRPQNDGYQIPGMPGMAGPRPDLEGRYEPKTMVGPDGNPVQVWAPGPAMREKKAADLEGRQAAYQVKKAGMDADREEAKKLWRATAMLAGGSQNINSGNRGMYNQLAMMDDANRERALLYMSPAGRLAAEVDAGGARNAMRMMNAEALAGMDPTRQAERQRANEAAEAGLPPEQATRLSITRGQPMGSGLSAAYVGSRWNHWMNNFGPRPESWREQNFRSEMEGLGYSPTQIDQWIDQRRGAGGEADPGLGTSTGPGGLPAPPGSTPYRTGA